MNRFQLITGLGFIFLLTAAGANAATLVSGAISFAHTSGNRLYCTVTNVSTRPITLESTQFFFGADPLNTGQQNAATDCSTLPMAPGASCANELTGASVDCFTCYCKVSFTGGKKSVRAVLTRRVFFDDVVAVPLY